MMARMADKIPGARFATIAGAGHIANLERPEAFNAALADFLVAQIRPMVPIGSRLASPR